MQWLKFVFFTIHRLESVNGEKRCGAMPFNVELDIKGSGGLSRCIWAGLGPAVCLANA